MGNFIKLSTGEVLDSCDFYNYLETTKGYCCEKNWNWFSEDTGFAKTGCEWKIYFKNNPNPCTDGVPPTFTVSPVISGSLGLGDTLTCDGGTCVGDAVITKSYQWYSNVGLIVGATSDTYIISITDSDKDIYCNVIASNGVFPNGVSDSNSLNVDNFTPVSTSTISISGGSLVGDLLTATQGTWTYSPTLTYQWYRGASVISGETGLTYTVTISDDGYNISCKETATNGAGSVTETSNSISISSSGSIDSIFVNSSNKAGVFRKNASEDLADYRLLIHSNENVISFKIGTLFSSVPNSAPPEFEAYETLQMLCAKTATSATRMGTWTLVSSSLLYNSNYYYSSVNNDYTTFSVSNSPSMIGIFDISVTGAKLAIVELNGDRTLANRLPMAQDLVLQGILPANALTTNGGTISPTDRMLNQVSPLETVYVESSYGTTSRRVVLAKNLTTSITSVKIICTSYNVGTGIFNLKLSGIWYDDSSKTIADIPSLTAQFQPIDEGATLITGASDINWAHSFVPDVVGGLPEWIGHSGSQYKVSSELYIDGILQSPIMQNDMTKIGDEIKLNVVGIGVHSQSTNTDGEVLQYAQNVIFRSDTGIEWSCPTYKWTFDGVITSGYLPQMATNNALTLCTLPEASQDYNLSGDAGASYWNAPASGVYFWNPKTNWAVLSYVPSYVGSPQGIISIQDRSGGSINKGYFSIYDNDTIITNDILAQRTVYYRFKKFSNATTTLSKGGVTLTAPSFSIAPAITGSTSFDSILTCSAGTCNGSSVIVRTYQWYVNGVLVSGATNNTYKIRAVASNQSIYCRVTASNGIGSDAISNSNTIIADSFSPTFTVSPVISGSLDLGDTLTCDGGTCVGTGIITKTYKWYRDAVFITGATSSTYVLVSADSDKDIYCEVIASNGVTTNAIDSSNVLSTNAFPPEFSVSPVISGSLGLGDTLTCDGGTCVGQSPITKTYQWYVNAVLMTGETNTTYVIQSGDSGKDVYCEVTATNGVSPDATINSNTLSISNFSAPAIVVNPVISGVIVSGQTLTTTDGTWTNSPYAYYYQWYRGVTPIGSGTNTYVLVNADIGQVIKCVVTADNGVTTNADSNTLTIYVTKLDTIGTSADGAVSNKLLRAAYWGSYCMDVRRSSDDAIQSFGFVISGGEAVVDTASILSFTGAGNGYISKRYDQSGNGRDWIQTTNGNQPRIVLSGVIDNADGYSSPLYDGATSYFVIDSSLNSIMSASVAHSIFAVVKSLVNNVNQYVFARNSASTNRTSLGVLSTSQFSYTLRTASIIGKSTPHSTSLCLLSTTQSPQNLYVNGAVAISANTLNNGTTAGIVDGRNNLAGDYFNGYITEMILFGSDITASRIAFENTIKTDYGL